MPPFTILQPLKAILLIAVVAVTLCPSTVTADFDAVDADNNRTDLSNSTRFLEEAATSDYHVRMLDAVNEQRTSRGLPKLCMNKELQNAAQSHSIDMARRNYLGHQGSDGSTMSSRISAAGFTWMSVAENVAAGQATVNAVMAAWMSSSGHKANILSTKYKMFGCGYAYNPSSEYTRYWTQDFATGVGEVCS